MALFSQFNIASSGMTAQRLRTDVISENIANVNTTRTSDGTPYVRKEVYFTEKGKSVQSFEHVFEAARNGIAGNGVKVTSIDATRSYEANVTAFNAGKSMATKGLEIGKA